MSWPSPHALMHQLREMGHYELALEVDASLEAQVLGRSPCHPDWRICDGVTCRQLHFPAV